MNDGQGSTGNVLAAICSLFIPGLGQLVQGRLMIALVMFALAVVLWFVGFFGVIPVYLIANIWSIIDAARYRPRAA
jgi:TM2 domain-containing membrane protein YozV